MALKLHWLLPSLGTVLLSGAAEAAQLQTWRFDANQNQLTFTTDEGVQPRAQLIGNPTRLVIDLPGILLGRPALQQSIGTVIRSVRVGQFNPETTRLVVELAPSYTLNPQQVRFRSESPTSWSVQLPRPQPLAQAVAPNPVAGSPRPVFRAPAVVAGAQTQINNIRVTPDGLFVDTSGSAPEVEVTRSRSRRQINIDLEGAALAYRLTDTAFSINRFGIGRLQATQVQTSPPVARIALEVAQNSPDWRASVSRLGGVVVLPRGGVAALPPGSRPRESFSLLPQSTPMSVQRPLPPPSKRSSTLADRPVVIPVPPAQASRSFPPAPLPPVANPSPPPVRGTPAARAIVVVDPGHGGPDPGAIGIGGLRETNVVLPISLEVARLLEQKGVQVVLTRSDERDVGLSSRVALAERVNADVFVSIHANAINLSRTDISGLETYYYGSGARLARLIHNSILQSVGVRDRGVRRARFFVLRKTSMPSVLVETGFVTGAEDAPKLANPTYQRQMAVAIAQGILQYLQGTP